MKPRVSPGMCLYQIVVQDFAHRQPPPKNCYVDKSGRGIREIVDTIPVRTLFRWSKKPKNAMAWAKKFGSILSCRKVDSHMRRLEMISHLRTEVKPIEVDISLEEYTIGRNLEITPATKSKKIDV